MITRLILCALAAMAVGCDDTARLKGVDHIVLGRVEQVDVVDGSGRPLAAEPEYTGRDALIRMKVRTTQVIRTSFAAFPATFERVYRPATPRKVSSERSVMNGKEWIFLASGTNLQSASWCGFDERITNEAALVRHLKAMPLE